MVVFRAVVVLDVDENVARASESQQRLAKIRKTPTRAIMLGLLVVT